MTMGGYVWLWLAFSFSHKLLGNFSVIFEILGSFCDVRQLVKFSLFELLNFLRLDTKKKLRKKKREREETHTLTHPHAYTVQIDEYKAKHAQSYYRNTVT